MTIDAQSRSEPADDLSDLLSEVWHADTQANNPRTREFLDAGEKLLRSGLARDAGHHTGKRGRFRAPFEELLNWVSRRRVIDQAEQTWRAAKRADGGKPSESAYRYRWRTQTGYLRDLVIYALRHRLASPDVAKIAAGTIYDAASDGFRGCPLDEALSKGAFLTVRDKKHDKAFRLQMVFQAILADDDHVADALRRINQSSHREVRDTMEALLRRARMRLRPDVDMDDYANALLAATDGVVYRSLLPGTSEEPGSGAPDHGREVSRPLALIAMALLVACTDPGDGKELRQAVREQLAQALKGAR